MSPIKNKTIALLFSITVAFSCYTQELSRTNYNAGFMTLRTADSTRIFKPDSPKTDILHYRPLDLDIWYPSTENNGDRLLFGDLFGLNEERATLYKEGDFSGITEEYAMFFAATLGLDSKKGNAMLKIKTDSYKNAPIAKGKHPIIIYMAGYNGMGYENYRLLEKLAEKGFIVVSVWSVGLYPGYMSNDILDTMEQVFDGELALNIIKNDPRFNVNVDKIGILGCSWGGMSAAMLLDRHQEIKAMATLDGSEVFYYGDTEEEDVLLTEIYDSDVLHPEKIKAAYLYMESGNKWDEFKPTGEYHYYKKLHTPKYYLRYIKSMHEDFTSIPSILKASEESVKIAQSINEGTALFFDEYLNQNLGFQSFKEQLIRNKDITDQPYEYDTKILKELILTGSVQDSKTNDMLPYVNIGVLNKDWGTVSNKKGFFELELNETHVKDTLRISMVGYKPQAVLVKTLMNRKAGYKINLEEQISELNEVVVTEKKWKFKTIGNKTKSKFLGTGFAYDMLGAELGVRVNIRKKPTFVRAFNFHVSYNRLGAKAIFRLNMYKIKNGKPTENILKESILIPVESGQTGLFTTDLKKYDIVLTDDVIVMLEWVEAEGEIKTGEGIFLSLGLFTGGTYNRKSSQGRVKKFRGLGVGYNLDVKY